MPARRPRRSSGFSWLYAAGGAVVAAVIAVAVLAPGRSAPARKYPFPCLGHESTVLHVHPYLRIRILGQDVTIPAAVGIQNPVYQQGLAVAGSCFEPMHTHDASNIIHIESPNPNQPYTLGDFFAIWADTYPTVTVGGQQRPVVYTADNLLGYRPDGTNKITLLVDGKPSNQGPALVLNHLDYCSDQTTGPPCYPTAVGNPNPPSIAQQYGTGHTIELTYGP